MSEFSNEKRRKRAETTYRFGKFLPAHPFVSRRSHRCRLISIPTNEKESYRQRQRYYQCKPAFSGGSILRSNGKRRAESFSLRNHRGCNLCGIGEEGEKINKKTKATNIVFIFLQSLLPSLFLAVSVISPLFINRSY